MYKKKDKKVMVIAAIIVAAIVAVIYILPGVIGSFGEKKEVQEKVRAGLEKLMPRNITSPFSQPLTGPEFTLPTSFATFRLKAVVMRERRIVFV